MITCFYCDKPEKKREKKITSSMWLEHRVDILFFFYMFVRQYKCTDPNKFGCFEYIKFNKKKEYKR